jgi:NAD(P) transhydrogenase subunit beta
MSSLACRGMLRIYRLLPLLVNYFLHFGHYVPIDVDVNPKMDTIDVCVVIGANDVVNPAALDDESSPIYGMPIIETHRAKTVIVLKRSMATGFAGIQNALFFYPNTRMYFGDAKASIQALVAEFKSAA